MTRDELEQLRRSRRRVIRRAFIAPRSDDIPEHGPGEGEH